MQTIKQKMMTLGFGSVATSIPLLGVGLLFTVFIPPLGLLLDAAAIFLFIGGLGVGVASFFRKKK